MLSKQLVMETQQMEISSFFAAAAALVMMLAAGLSLAWFSRMILRHLAAVMKYQAWRHTKTNKIGQIRGLTRGRVLYALTRLM